MPRRRLERLIVKDFASEKPTGHKEKLLQSHRVRAMLDAVQERSAKLVSQCACLPAALAPLLLVHCRPGLDVGSGMLLAACAAVWRRECCRLRAIRLVLPPSACIPHPPSPSSDPHLR